MILPDVNLLLYAHHLVFPQQREAQGWWERLLASDEEIGLASVVVFGFVRISTSARVLATPMSVDEAVARVRAWLAQPNVRRLDPGPRHLDIAFDLLRSTGAGGNLTTDAQIAALAMEHGAEIHSADTDFARFSGVRWRNPLAKDRRKP